MTDWLLDPANWNLDDGIPIRILEHIVYSLMALALAAAVAMPIGLYVGHTRKGTFLIAGLANALRALPSLGLIVLLFILVGPAFKSDLAFEVPSLIVLLLLAVPPIMTGTYAGMVAIDPAVIDAAHGMGYKPMELLFRIELPCALPLILSGFRSAALQIVSTATIAAYVSLGGLGRLIIDGFAQHDYGQMVTGAVLVGILALLVDLVIGWIAAISVSPGLTRKIAKRASFRDA